MKRLIPFIVGISLGCGVAAVADTGRIPSPPSATREPTPRQPVMPEAPYVTRTTTTYAPTIPVATTIACEVDRNEATTTKARSKNHRRNVQKSREG